MKTSTTFLVFLFSFFTAVHNTSAGDSPVEFRGYIEFDGEQLFSLKSIQGGGSSWVRLGQSFCKGELVDYDRVNKSVTFSSSEGAFKLKMFEAEGFGNLAKNYVISNQMDSANVNLRAITGTANIPRALAAPTREKKGVAGYEGKLSSYNNTKKSATSSSSGGTSKVKMLKADGSAELAGNYGTSNQFSSANVNRRAATRRGSIPRVPTSRTREEKEAARQAINYSN
jgi:hypothetical protein